VSVCLIDWPHLGVPPHPHHTHGVQSKRAHTPKHKGRAHTQKTQRQPGSAGRAILPPHTEGENRSLSGQCVCMQCGSHTAGRRTAHTATITPVNQRTVTLMQEKLCRSLCVRRKRTHASTQKLPHEGGAACKPTTHSLFRSKPRHTDPRSQPCDDGRAPGQATHVSV